MLPLAGSVAAQAFPETRVQTVWWCYADGHAVALACSDGEIAADAAVVSVAVVVSVVAAVAGGLDLSDPVGAWMFLLENADC